MNSDSIVPRVWSHLLMTSNWRWTLALTNVNPRQHLSLSVTRAFPSSATGHFRLLLLVVEESASEHVTSASSLPDFIGRLKTYLFSLFFSW